MVDILLQENANHTAIVQIEELLQNANLIAIVKKRILKAKIHLQKKAILKTNPVEEEIEKVISQEKDAQEKRFNLISTLSKGEGNKNKKVPSSIRGDFLLY